MYFKNTPILSKLIYRNVVWKIDANEKAVYLTFDDGPDPSVTPYVLEILKQYNAKATFFCLGKNVETNPLIYETIIKEGHSAGNHTYSHLDGWKTHTKDYLLDVSKCETIIKSTLFRSPYGRIKPSQLAYLRKKYSVVLWTTMSGDFDLNLKKEKCLYYLLNSTKKGSIIVFHDIPKAKDKLQFVLPAYLKYLKDNGYKCCVVPAPFASQVNAQQIK